jgi:predicted kinase
MSNATVYMTCGLPFSGKSTWTIENAEKLNAEVLSSDKFRELLYGNASIQGDNIALFEYIFKRAKELLDEGKNVIIDATNINRKKRMHFNKIFKKYNREIVYFNTSHLACILRDSSHIRERTVGEDVIKRMFLNLQVPTYSEGWNSIKIVCEKYINPFSSKEYFEDKLLNDWSYERMFSFPFGLGEFTDFIKISELPQDNPHHTFSVSRHTYHVYKYVYDNYMKSSKNLASDFVKMLWVAILHDVGKGYTKTFTDLDGNPKPTASFYWHENVSGQIACSILNSLGYDDSFILEVVELVQLHMKLMNAKSERSMSRFKKTISENTFNNLKFLFEADTSAK